MNQFCVCSVCLVFVAACLFVVGLKSICPYQCSGWEEITEQKQQVVLYDQALIGETKSYCHTVYNIGKTDIKTHRYWQDRMCCLYERVSEHEPRPCPVD